MGKQWVMVGAVAAGLTLGAAAVIWVRPGENEAVAVGAEAPDYRVYHLGIQDSVSLRKHYAGHVTLVNIWATWCVPCKIEMPAMERLYDSLGPRGFRIAAVSIDEGPAEQVRSFASDLGLTFDILQDRTGRIQQVYQTTGVPESFLIDEKGIILKRVIGAHDWVSPVNVALVERLLARSGATVPAASADSAPSATLHGPPPGR
jgi:cytochrome c biogenesis protein CcmG, thiol:disulfide interchange protein DsbE